MASSEKERRTPRGLGKMGEESGSCWIKSYSDLAESTAPMLPAALGLEQAERAERVDAPPERAETVLEDIVTR